MTDKELKELVASLAVSNKELQANQKEMQKEFEKERQETWNQIKQVNKQIGEIGNKWGSFAEGMAIESIKKILRTNFNISFTAQNVFKRLSNNEAIEIDAFGYENSTVNTAVIVEIKSHLREDAIEQLEETIEKFPKFFPDHADKKLFGIIACVHAPENLKNVLRKKGIYLAVLNDDVFTLFPFQNFTPKNFNQ